MSRSNPPAGDGPQARKVSELDDTVFLGDTALRENPAILQSEELAASYPSGDVRVWHKAQGDPITGPPQLIQRQAELRKHHTDLSGLEPRKSLCFVFGVGEDTDDRATTRIGGLPYWPKDLPWPTSGGQPKAFTGQLDFRDVIWPEPLPGDLLTIHEDLLNDEHHGQRDGPGMTLTWQATTRQAPLLERGEVPVNEDIGETGPFYSLPVAETDYKFSRSWGDTGPAGFRRYTLHATKIGGHTPYFGTNWKEALLDVVDPVFLCSIGPLWEWGPKGWLPPKPGYTATKARDSIWLDVATVVITYPRGKPEDLRWIWYMP